MSDQPDYRYFTFDNRNYRICKDSAIESCLWQLLEASTLVRLLDSWEIEAAGVITKPVRMSLLNYNPQHKA